MGEHPLLQAAFTRDTEVLGDLVAERAGQPIQGHKFAFLHGYHGLLRSRGLLRTDLSADDLHPNEKGYQIMAPLVEAAIAKALK